MIETIGIIGAGHMAAYLMEGFSKSGSALRVFLSGRNPDNVKRLAEKYDCKWTIRNQELIDNCSLIMVCVRPDDVKTALSGLYFKDDQMIVSAAAGISLQKLSEFSGSTNVYRIMPISCVAINKSPILLFPANNTLESFLSCLGSVYVLPNEDMFAPATSLVGAFYAWIFALMDEAAQWIQDQGMSPETARNLTIETIEGACGMAGHQGDLTLKQIWETLATPGGISEYGAEKLNEKGCIKAWSKALESVMLKMIDSDK